MSEYNCYFQLTAHGFRSEKDKEEFCRMFFKKIDFVKSVFPVNQKEELFAVSETDEDVYFDGYCHSSVKADLMKVPGDCPQPLALEELCKKFGISMYIESQFEGPKTSEYRLSFTSVIEIDESGKITCDDLQTYYQKFIEDAYYSEWEVDENFWNTPYDDKWDDRRNMEN